MLAGGRYTYLDIEIDLDGISPGTWSEVDGDKDWLDIFIGGRISLDLIKKLIFVLRSDVGGFGFSFS